jgi:broad specificity phosphatase PhoE
MKLLIVYRHGERSDEAPDHRKVDFECVSDAPLTVVGHEQAEIASEVIFRMIPDPTSVHLVSSPLIRCIQTASKLSKKLSTPIYLEEGFGECYCQHHFPINPFDNLHIRLKPEMFEDTLSGVRIIENDHKFRPNNPETIEELNYRMSLMMKEYIINCVEDTLVVCTHFLPVKVLTQMLGSDTELQSQHTIITAAVYENNEFRVLKSGCYQHLPQRLVKPIP